MLMPTQWAALIIIKYEHLLHKSRSKQTGWEAAGIVMFIHVHARKYAVVLSETNPINNLTVTRHL